MTQLLPTNPRPNPTHRPQELVKSIDALSRDQLRALLQLLGLENASLPVLLPGASRCDGAGGLRDGAGGMAEACSQPGAGEPRHASTSANRRRRCCHPPPAALQAVPARGATAVRR